MTKSEKIWCSILGPILLVVYFALLGHVVENCHEGVNSAEEVGAVCPQGEADAW